MPNGPDEAVDFELVRSLIFKNSSVSYMRFTDAEQRSGKTPDFRLIENGELVGLVEVKSPRDDWLDQQIEQSAGEIAGGPRPDPTWNRIGRQIKNAAKQFAAVDPGRAVPHVLVIVNHDEMACYGDLRVSVFGFERTADGHMIQIQPGAAEGVRKAAVPQVDLILWIDAQSEQIRDLENETRPEHVSRAFQILGIPRAALMAH